MTIFRRGWHSPLQEGLLRQVRRSELLLDRLVATGATVGAATTGGVLGFSVLPAA